ncbi:MAG TPA: hypothetical protein VF952_05615 [Chloroflexia bacterium]|jgi:hypothetical protein
MEPQIDQTHPYKVIVSDNFHHMDKGEEYTLGEFCTCEAAITACKRIVDDYLLSTYKPIMSAEELWKLYTSFGDSAFIVSAGQRCRFSSWDYAQERCAELCRSKGAET